MTIPLPIKTRILFPNDFVIDTIENLSPYLEPLLESDISNADRFHTLLLQLSEAEAVIGEAACWAQINMTCDTENKNYQHIYNYFYTHIQPYLQTFSDKINKKIIASPFSEQLPQTFFVYLRNIKKSIALFREANIPLHSELAILQQEYGNITSKMMVEIQGKEMTLQQATSLLKEQDRDLRKAAYFKIQERRFEDKDQLNQLFTTLVNKRNELAHNCDYNTYTSYKFQELGRFDYGAKECFLFHQGIQQHILPLLKQLYLNKQQQLQLETLYPWDLDAPAPNEKPLTPFKNAEELVSKTIACLQQVDQEFALCIIEMQRLQRLDLESRKGKAPGGYNCPLPETGVPFIFMNAAGTLDDVITMVHESGHAVHSFLSHDLELSAFKEYPMEIAELASMSMELFTLQHWDIFFDDKDERKRAQLQQWERVLSIFPWIAIIDSFQHWVYDHPQHSEAERLAQWQHICNTFKTNIIDDSLSTKFAPYTWQKQLHLYEVPFYYIEYGIAQLGAVAMYRQFKENKTKCLKNYKAALKMGGKLTLPELYNLAGITLRFDEQYIQELSEFVQNEIALLRNTN